MKNKAAPSTLPGDSKDYDLITRAIEAIPNGKEGMTCEIGLRQGGGTKYIINALSHKNLPYKVHIAIDPFGNIVYARKDGVNRRMNYTNEMRDTSLGFIYQYAMSKSVNFVFINLEDVEFFKRYSDGVPVYSDNKHLLEKYIFVHFDGPHQADLVLEELLWFDERMTAGATAVFDDINDYNHDMVEEKLKELKWMLLEKTGRKASYQKT
jgi:hypothetical protein